MTFAPRKRGRPTGSRKVHPDRDKLIHFVVESVISHTGLGVGRGESSPADIDACIVATWILSGGRKCADYVRGLEQGKYLENFALHLTEILKPHLEQASDRDQLVRQLLGVDHLTVRHAYRRVQAAQLAGRPCARMGAEPSDPSRARGRADRDASSAPRQHAAPGPREADLLSTNSIHLPRRRALTRRSEFPDCFDLSRQTPRSRRVQILSVAFKTDRSRQFIMTPWQPCLIGGGQ